MDNDFINGAYIQIIDTIKLTHPKDLSQAVLLGTLLSEYLIKEALKSASPIAPYSLQFLNTAHSDFAALIRGKGDKSPKLKYEDLGILLDRAKALEIIDLRAIELIGSIKNIRNGIMHDPEFSYDRLEAHARLLELFINHGSPFDIFLGTKQHEADIIILRRTRTHIEGKIGLRLENKIKSALDFYKDLADAEIKDRISGGASKIAAEDTLIESMLCPACKNNTLYYLLYIDFDYNSDGNIISGGTWFECSVCELEMSVYDFEDLYDNPQKYTSRTEPDRSWKQYFEYKSVEENAYEYL